MKKDRYIYTIAVVRDTINKLDPIGLLSQGAPKDEYDEEIQRIVSGLRTCDSMKKIQKLIYNIFKEYFGQKTAGNKGLYLEAAKEIFEKVKRK